MEQFYLFFYDPSLKDLLLFELKDKFPQLNLSFSNKEFISMKGRPEDEGLISSNFPIMAKRVGVFMDKTEESSETSILVGKLYWNYRIIKSSTDTYEIFESPLPEKAPSRAYHKMEQVVRLFNLPLKKGEQVVEIGSAPGGISYYLMEIGLKLVTIDPADFDPYVSSHYPDLFIHLKESVFDVNKDKLPRKCDWIVSDLNLAGDLNTNQVLRFLKFFPKTKAAKVALKIDKWKALFEKHSYKVQAFHLPSHRREIGMLVSK